MRFIQQIPVGQTSRWFAGAILLVVSMAQLSCQSTSSSQETNPTSLKAQASIRDERKRPDSADWRSANDSGPVELTVTGELSAYEFTVDPALETGAEVWIGLWACGIKMGELRFVQERGKNELKYTEVARWDPVALELLQAYPDPKMRDRDSLLVRYAKGLLEGDAPYAGFPATMPKGIDSALVVRTALRLAVAARVGVDSLSKHWLLALSVAQVRASLPSLVASGWLEPSDTLSLFPPPPVRVVEPLGVVGAVEAGGNFADVLGRFEWNADLGQITVDAQVTYEGRRIESVAMTSLAIGTGERFLALTGKARLLAGSAAPVGICSLVVVVRSEKGDAARAATSFEVKAATAPPQAPVIGLVSPLEGAAFPFDSARIDVVWKVTSARSPVDTVLVADSLATKLTDSTWKARIPLAATGKSALVAVRARNAQGLWGTGSANFTRAKDQAAPDLVWLASGEDTAVESDVTFFVARLRAADASGIASVTFGEQAPDSVLAGGVYAKRIELGAPGTSVTIFVAVTDSAGNRTEASRKVVRKASNSLEIYGLPDTLRVWEDSVLEHRVQVNCPTGSTCTVTAKVSDTTLAQVSVAGTATAPAIRIVPRSDRNGAVDLDVELSTGTRKASAIARLVVKPGNDAPSLSVKASAMASPMGEVRITDWLVSSLAGPSDESGQKLRYTVAADSAASLLSGAPAMDEGALVFSPKGISGTVRFSIVALDDGDSVAPSVNKSTPQTLRVKLDAPPTLRVRDTLIGYEDQRTALDTIRIDDVENPADLNLDWKVLDSALLPRANLRVKSVPGGYSYDALGAPDSNGLARIAWTLTDPAGNVVKDTTAVRIVPVNHAPSAQIAPAWSKRQSVAVYDMLVSFPKLFTSVHWGDSGQSGTWSLRLANPTDTGYISNPLVIRPDSGVQIRPTGKVGDVDLHLVFRDNGGSKNGGVDTMVYSLRLAFTNTVSDVQGNEYPAILMPDGRWWMGKNLRTRPEGKSLDTCGGQLDGPEGYRVTADCGKFGALYTWIEAMRYPDSCAGINADCSKLYYSTYHQDICPDGWYMPLREEWGRLFASVAIPGNADSTINLRSKDVGWASFADYPPWTYPGFDLYNSFFVATDRGAAPCKGCYGTNFWEREQPVPGASPLLVITQGISDYWSNRNSLGSVRCIKR